MKIKTLKNQKPIDTDIHLKYLCPNTSCGYTHWLSLKETQTKNFKVVCDCGTVFQPKTVKKLKLIYLARKKSCSNQTKTSVATIDNEVPQDLLNKAKKILIGYGFDALEAENLIKDSFKQKPEKDCVKLVKNTLVLFGG
jgi:hypothetical protein